MSDSTTGCPEITKDNLYGFNDSDCTTDVETKIKQWWNGIWGYINESDRPTNQWCYYKCKWDSFWSYEASNKYCCSKKSCKSLPNGVDSSTIMTRRQPWDSNSRSRTYKNNADYENISSNAVGCFYTCKEGYRPVNRWGVTVCVSDSWWWDNWWWTVVCNESLCGIPCGWNYTYQWCVPGQTLPETLENCSQFGNQWHFVVNTDGKRSCVLCPTWKTWKNNKCQ